MFVSVLDGKCITFFVAKANPVGFQSKYLGRSSSAKASFCKQETPKQHTKILNVAQKY
jgi:hypothetical protein